MINLTSYMQSIPDEENDLIDHNKIIVETIAELNKSSLALHLMQPHGSDDLQVDMPSFGMSTNPFISNKGQSKIVQLGQLTLPIEINSTMPHYQTDQQAHSGVQMRIPNLLTQNTSVKSYANRSQQDSTHHQVRMPDTEVLQQPVGGTRIDLMATITEQSDIVSQQESNVEQPTPIDQESDEDVEQSPNDDVRNSSRQLISNFVPFQADDACVRTSTIKNKTVTSDLKSQDMQFSNFNATNKSKHVSNQFEIEKIDEESPARIKILKSSESISASQNSKVKSVKEPSKDEESFLDGSSVNLSQISKNEREIENVDKTNDNPDQDKKLNEISGDIKASLVALPSKCKWSRVLYKDGKLSCPFEVSVLERYPILQYKINSIVNSKRFDLSLFAIIILNSIALSLYDYNDLESSKYTNMIIDKLNIAFTIVYILEAIIRISLDGFVMHQGSYLRNGWNIIDFIVIICGLLETFLPVSAHKGLRVLRVIRPIKTIKTISSMKKLIQSLIFSLPDFGNVGVFLVFIFLLFATMGLHQYNGDIYNACRINPAPETPTSWAYDDSERVCSKTGLGNFICPNNLYCGNPSEFPSVTLEDDNVQQKAYINYGITSFDNLGSSLLTVFQMITGDTWALQLQNLMDADITYIGAIYAILVIIVGQFFLLNLILAVIIEAFIKIQKQALEEKFEKMATINESNKQAPENASKISKMLTRIKERGDSEESEDSEEQSHARQVIRNTTANKMLRQKTKRQRLDSQRQSMIRKSKSVIDEKNQNQGEVSQEIAELWKGREHLDNDAEMQKFLKPLAQKRIIANMFSALKPLVAAAEAEEEEEKKQQEEREKEELAKLGDNVLNIHTFNNNQIEMIDTFANPFEGGESESLSASNKSQVSPAFFNEKKENWGAQDLSSNPSDLKLSGIRMHQKASPNSLHKDAWSPNNSATGRSEKTVKSKINGKVNSNFEKHLSKVLRDAKETFIRQKTNNDDEQKGETIRQLVGLKFCIEANEQIQEEIVQSQNQVEIDKRINSNRLYRLAYNVSQTNWFSSVVFVTVVLNMLLLSFDQYPIQYQEVQLYEQLNIMFVVIYMIEFIIKMCGFGPKYYFVGNKYNIYDSVIVAVSLIDIIVSFLILQTLFKESLANGIGITVLRSLRLLRIFKLARSWKRFELLLETFGKTLRDVGAFSLLVLLILFIYAILGLEFFAQKAKFNSSGEVDNENGSSPMFNFDTFFNSIFTVFIILTNDGQSTIFYDYFRAVSGPLSTVFWVTLVVLGQKMLLNLFLAFILEHFDEGSLKEKLMKLEEEEQRKIEKEDTENLSVTMRIKNKLSLCWENFKERVGLNEEEIDEDEMPSLNNSASMRLSPDKRSKSIGATLKTLPSFKMNQTHADHAPPEKIDIPDTDTPILYGRSLKLFSIRNRFRKFLFKMSNHRRFNLIIIIFILASSVQLALDTPLNDPNSQLKFALKWVDIVTTTVFILEAIVKIISLGLYFNGPWSYLKQSWNLLDFTIIIFSLISLTPLSDNLTTFKMMRIFRALRLVTKNDGLKVAVRALFLAIPNVANVAVIMIMFFFIFGVISVSYFKGKQFICLENQEVSNFALPSTKWDCINSGGEWQNRVSTFDDIPNALVTLFSMATTVGWSQIAVYMATATDIDYISDVNGDRSVGIILFYVLFMLIGYFFFLNLFVGVVISTFNSEQDKLGGNHLLTDKQKEWIELRLLVLRSQPLPKMQPPTSRCRKFFFDIHAMQKFHNIILACIIANTLVLCFKWYEESQAVYSATETINYIFTGIFMIEALVKTSALGVKMYFADGWNIFDFFVMVGTFISIFIATTSSLQLKGATTVFRAFRILRILRLLKRGGRSLSLIFNTFVITMHSLVNIGGLLLVFIYMYSILGMIVFGDVKRNDAMNSYINFENFPNAFVTLFIISTGDSWTLFMQSFTMGSSPLNQCISSPTYYDYVANGYQAIGCGGKIESYLFFVSYVFVVNLVFLKIFIAIILQGYNSTQVQNLRLFNLEMSEKFSETWAEFDPEAKGYIKLAEIRSFLMALGEPLGFHPITHSKKYMQDRFIASLDLPTYHNFSSYQFLDVLDALSFRLMVLDHIKKAEILEAKGGTGGFLGPDDPHAAVIIKKQLTPEENEKNIKAQMQREINRLVFQKKSENITAVKEVWEKEMKKIKNKENNKDQGGFNSSHHMAAELAVIKMKAFVRRMVRERYQIVYQQDQVRKKIGRGTLLNIGRQQSNLFQIKQSEDGDSFKQDKELQNMASSNWITQQQQVQTKNTQRNESTSVLKTTIKNTMHSLKGESQTIQSFQNTPKMSGINNTPKGSESRYGQSVQIKVEDSWLTKKITVKSSKALSQFSRQQYLSKINSHDPSVSGSKYDSRRTKELGMLPSNQHQSSSIVYSKEEINRKRTDNKGTTSQLESICGGYSQYDEGVNDDEEEDKEAYIGHTEVQEEENECSNTEVSHDQQAVGNDDNSERLQDSGAKLIHDEQDSSRVQLIIR